MGQPDHPRASTEGHNCSQIKGLVVGGGQKKIWALHERIRFCGCKGSKHGSKAIWMGLKIKAQVYTPMNYSGLTANVWNRWDLSFFSAEGGLGERYFYEIAGQERA